MKTPPERFFRYIRAKGYKTGSHVLGGWRRGSDLDYILMYDSFMKSYERFYTYLVDPDPDIYPDAHKVVYVTNEDGQVFNLLMFKKKQDMQNWIDTTKLLLQLQKIDPVFIEICKHKTPRVALFKMVREHKELMQ